MKKKLTAISAASALLFAGAAATAVVLRTRAARKAVDDGESRVDAESEAEAA